MMWRGGALPDLYRGARFSCDPTGNLVHVDKLVPRGATFSAEPLLGKARASRVARRLVPPGLSRRAARMARSTSATCTGASSSIPDYLAEEMRKRTDFEGGKTMGRIWRVTKKDAKWEPDHFPRVRLGTSAWLDDAVAIVAHETGWAQRMAFRLLAERRANVRTDGTEERTGRGKEPGELRRAVRSPGHPWCTRIRRRVPRR